MLRVALGVQRHEFFPGRSHGLVPHPTSSYVPYSLNRTSPSHSSHLCSTLLFVQELRFSPRSGVGLHAHSSRRCVVSTLGTSEPAPGRSLRDSACPAAGPLGLRVAPRTSASARNLVPAVSISPREVSFETLF